MNNEEKAQLEEQIRQEQQAKQHKKTDKKLCDCCGEPFSDNIKFVCFYHKTALCEKCVKNNYQREIKYYEASHCKTLGYNRQDCIYEKRLIE